jgi:hypothetical protein
LRKFPRNPSCATKTASCATFPGNVAQG